MALKWQCEASERFSGCLFVLEQRGLAFDGPLNAFKLPLFGYVKQKCFGHFFHLSGVYFKVISDAKDEVPGS